MRLLIALIFVLVSCYVTRAQDFDFLDEPPAEPVAAVEADSPDTSEGDELGNIVLRPASAAIRTAIEVIEAQDPQKPFELIAAVNIFRRLGAYEQAKSYLERATSQELDSAKLMGIYEEIGTGELVPLANDKALMPEARELVFRVFSEVKSVKRDPKRLKSLIEQLADDDDETRRVAKQQLALAGAYAVPALLDAYRNAPKDVSINELDAAMARIGGAAEDALIAAIGAPDVYIQSIAARALGRVGSKRARLHLIRPYFSGDRKVQGDAKGALRRLGSGNLNSVANSVTYLRGEALRHLNGKTPFEPDYDGTLEMWTWDAEKQNVVFHRLSKHEAAALTAARIARDVYELSPTSENTCLLMVSRLESDQLLTGLDSLLPKEVGSAYDFAKTWGANAIFDALGYSLEKGHDAAAIGASELVGDVCVGGVAGGNYWTPLTRALQSPNRRVRYAAARAMMKIDPRRAYTGSSFMLEALVELADVSGVPGAVVATPNTSVRNRLSGMMGSLGFAVYQANEGNACLREAMRASDYDVILLSDSTSRPTADETIQQLRKDPQTKLTPVILLGRDLRMDRSRLLASLDDRVVLMPEFADQETLTSRLKDVEKLVSGVSVPPTRRLAQAKDALNWLGHLAEYSKTYPWYDVMRAQDVAIKAMPNPALAESAVKLLGYLGDEPSQKILVAAAGQKSLSAEYRQRAANAFGEAVLRRGLMLRRAEVYSQYDRYNASETEDRKTQEILGQVLDVIETQTKPTSLPNIN